MDLAASEAETIVSWSQVFESVETVNRLKPIVVPANEQHLGQLSDGVLHKLNR